MGPDAAVAASEAAAGVGSPAVAEGLSDREAEEVEEHLRGLGYLE